MTGGRGVLRTARSRLVTAFKPRLWTYAATSPTVRVGNEFAVLIRPLRAMGLTFPCLTIARRPHPTYERFNVNTFSIEKIRISHPAHEYFGLLNFTNPTNLLDSAFLQLTTKLPFSQKNLAFLDLYSVHLNTINNPI